MALNDKVKSIIAEQLGVKKEEVNENSKFIDDLGATLVFDPADTVGLSLAPGSPSLLAGSALDVAFGVGGAMSPADVFVYIGGGPAFYIPAGVMGLLPTDNIDALETVPEPATMSLLAIGAAALIKRKRS